MFEYLNEVVPQVNEFFVLTASDISCRKGAVMQGRLKVGDILLCTQAVQGAKCEYRLVLASASYVEGLPLVFQSLPLGQKLNVNMDAQQLERLKACECVENDTVRKEVARINDEFDEKTKNNTRTVTLHGRPEATFTMNAEEAAILLEASQLHYDHTCKMASAEGGFIATWHRMTTQEGMPASWRSLTGEFRQFDTALKCLEFPLPSLTAEQKEVSSNLFGKFWDICTKMNELYAQWQYAFEVPDAKSQYAFELPTKNA